MISPTCPEVSSGGRTSSGRQPQTVLIADATCVIGRELAREFARHRLSLVIVGGEGPALTLLASQLRHDFRVDVLAIVNDLRSDAAAAEVVREVTAAGWELTIIATNLGIFARTA